MVLHGHSQAQEDKHLGIWRGPNVCASCCRACDLQSKHGFLQFQFTAVTCARYSYFDTRIVRRSNMLLADMGGKPYGKSLNFLQFSVLPTDAWRAGKKHINKAV